MFKNFKGWVIGIILIGSVVFASRDLFKPGYFSIHDDLQVGRLYEMDLCFKDGQIPCRWVPDMGYSYGYPLYNYYPSFPYYLGEAFHLIGFNFLDSTKIMFMTSFLVSAILMFLLGRRLWGGWGGLVSAILYLWAPYHSIDVYVRGAMNEAWAMAFLPGVCWAVYEIIDKNKARVREIANLALMFGLLLLSHNLMAFIFSPIIGGFALVLLWFKKKEFKEKIGKLLLGAGWGVGLAAFFTLPVLIEKKYVHVETMLMGYFNYLAHYVSVGKMLFTRFWGYGSSGWLQETGMPFQVGFPHWPLAVLVFLLGAFLFWRKKINQQYFFIITYFFIVFGAALFMVHPRSVFIWDRISLLAYLQFPWRFLTLVAFAISVLGGGLVFFLKDQKKQIILSIIAVVAVISLNYSFFRVEKIFPMTDTEKLFSFKGWNKLQTDAIFDYLPVYAKAPPGGPAPKEPEIKEGVAKIVEASKGTNWYNFKVEVQKEAKVQIPVYDFPGWEARVDGKKVVIFHDNFLGLITVKLSNGNHEVKLELKNTPIRWLGNTLSLLSWGALLFLSIKRTKRS